MYMHIMYKLVIFQSQGIRPSQMWLYIYHKTSVPCSISCVLLLIKHTPFKCQIFRILIPPVLVTLPVRLLMSDKKCACLNLQIKAIFISKRAQVSFAILAVSIVIRYDHHCYKLVWLLMQDTQLILTLYQKSYGWNKMARLSSKLQFNKSHQTYRMLFELKYFVWNLGTSILSSTCEWCCVIFLKIITGLIY